MTEAATRFVYEPNPSRIVFGPDCLDDIAAEAERLSIRRALIVTTRARRSLAERAATLLGASCTGIYGDAVPNMPRASFDRAMADLSAGAVDGVISIGGGSPIGLGKALGVKAGVPQIAVPTTYSGSELRGDWRIEGPDGVENGTDDAALPRTVIYDPVLTMSLPPEVSGPSGMNVAAHAVESIYSPRANLVSTAMGLEGLRLLARSLPEVVRRPDDLAARTEALHGAWLAGGFRAGSCLEHRIAQRLRSLFGLSHAQSHAVVLPYVVAFNEPAAPETMAAIAEALGATGAAEGVFALNDTLGIPRGLQEIGVPESGLDRAADVIAEVPVPNPRPAGREEIRRLIDDAYHGRRPAI